MSVSDVRGVQGAVMQRQPLSRRLSFPKGLTSSRQRAERVMARRLLATDVVVLLAVVVLGYAIVFGDARGLAVSGSASIPYAVFSLGLVASWVSALTIGKTRDPRVVGAGYEEYQRVFQVSFQLFAGMAVCAVLFRWDLSRGFLATVFSAGVIGLMVSRQAWRRWLGSKRAEGRFGSKILVVGGVRSASRIGHELEQDRRAGYQVVGVWIPDAVTVDERVIDIGTHSVPVLGTEWSIAEALAVTRADTVLATDTEHLGHEGMSELGWELEATDVRLLVAPNVLDVAGPRMHVGAAGNLPFIHLAAPRYKGAIMIWKASFDRIFAAIALTVLAPVLLATAVAVKLTSPGPIIYRQVRVGKDSTDFVVWKFRSMRVGAESEMPALIAAGDGLNGALFKLTNDPRVTSVGRFIRRYSIDELPQFVNVLRGEMSVVGPRPHLPNEVATYDRRTSYRLRVRPGITGLWQVSGRSNLSWSDAVRLDLDYVENWSMFRDLQIVWRTIRAVVKSDGAY